MISSAILDRFREIVLNIEIVEHRVRRGVAISKTILTLSDGTSLRVLEVRIDGEIRKYSYYWLDDRNDLLIGWDNAAHHPHIETFPHHRHRAEQVEASQQRNLQEVLSYISEQISGRV